jgi:putative ABC transport system substrate-binding protein
LAVSERAGGASVQDNSGQPKDLPATLRQAWHGANRPDAAALVGGTGQSAMVDMRRRDFVLALGAAAAWPLAARAQQRTMPVVGYLYSSSARGRARQMTGFQQGLGATGYTAGQNVAIHFSWAEGHYDRLPELAADLVRRQVAVIFAAGGTAPAQAAKAATAKIPIVFSSGGDPVAEGLVASLNRPGGNITGVSLMFSDLVGKRLGLLHELVPKAALIGVLVNPDYSDVDLQLKQLQEAARALRQELHVESARTELEIGTAFEIIVQRGAAAILLVNDPFFSAQRNHIVALATRYAIPAIYEQREYALAGGLMSYGPSLADALRQGGIYVGRILKGQKPADLPVVQSTKFDLVINLKTAQTLGLAIPPGVLAIADEVIE